MKKIFLLLLIPMFLISCSKQDTTGTLDEAKQQLDQVKDQVNDTRGVIQDTTEVINDYADTLQGSIQDAKEVRDLYNQKAQDLQEDIRNAYK